MPGLISNSCNQRNPSIKSKIYISKVLSLVQNVLGNFRLYWLVEMVEPYIYIATCREKVKLLLLSSLASRYMINFLGNLVAISYGGLGNSSPSWRAMRKGKKMCSSLARSSKFSCWEDELTKYHWDLRQLRIFLLAWTILLYKDATFPVPTQMIIEQKKVILVL